MVKSFSARFAQRSALCFFIIVVLLFVCCLRVFTIAVSPEYSLAANEQSSYTLTLAGARGTVYDRNMRALTNREYKIMAAISPTPRAVTVISSVLEGERRTAVLEKLESGMPAVCEVEKEIDCDGIICVKVPVHMSEDQLAVQLIGYTDSTGHGVTGLQRAYDDILYCEEGYKISYATDGHSNILPGVDAVEEQSDAAFANAIITTLDMNIQLIAENAAESIKKGAILISEVGTGEILAMVSRPDYDPLNISASLENGDSPFLNRCLCAYNVGSVFKPCVAAAAMESSSAVNFTHNCTGSTVIDSHTFNCHNRAGHALMDMKNAISLSCNTFFYNFAQSVGANSIYATANALGFGSSISLAPGISTVQENMTNLTTVRRSPRALANLAIGQGDLLASPVVLLNLYSAIAGDGTYTLPSVVCATIKDGTVTEQKKAAPTRVMSEQNASILRNCLLEVVQNGTGTKARPHNCTAGGKTATAETGWKNSAGKPVSQSWFCGFFPFENPKYVAVILAEDSVSGGEDCAPVFKRICEDMISAGF